MVSLKFACLLCLPYFLALAIFVNAKRTIATEFMKMDITEKDEVPRVRIKVFQSSPKVQQNGKQFSTWGFWIKQPAEADLS